ncbi:MAG: sensor histidine kinase [Gemmatimonadaceae bacterium]
MTSSTWSDGLRTDRRSGTDRRSWRLEQERLRSIVERMADGIVIVGLDGAIRFTNPAAEQLFGRSADELKATNFGFPAVAGDTAAIEVVRPRGETVSVELRVVDIDWEGNPARLVSLRDVTDRKRAEENERRLTREQAARVEAEAASRAKSEFLATMSHELRTPLNAIIGYGELLDLGIAGPLNAEQRQQVHRITTSGRHLLGLVNEVLDLAKLEAGRLTVSRDARHARGAVDAAVMLLQSQAEERGLMLMVRGTADRELVYLGDEDRVRQILLHLLSNAIKFSEAGDTISIEVGRTPRPDSTAKLYGGGGEWVFFRVSDTGIGIAPDQLRAIFTPFFQAEGGHTRRREGSGLGLPIARRLARLMNGDLTVESTLREGSSFTLWLPAADTDGPRMSERQRAPLSGHEPRVQGLADVGETMLRETESIIDAFVSRLRREEVAPAAARLRFSQVANHVATLLADVGESLIVLEDSGGHPTLLMQDGVEIQRLVAERHGAQRARLGWNEDMLRRELGILSQEVERALRHRLGDAGGRIDEAIGVIRRQLDEATRIAIRALQRAKREERGERREERGVRREE